MKPSIAVCVPSQDRVLDEFDSSLAAQMHSLGMDGFDRAVLIKGRSSTGAFRARNQIMMSLDIVEQQVKYKFDWTIWFDSDMVFPSRTVQGLLSHDKDIVAATYKRRAPPFELMGKPLGGHGATVAIGSLAGAEALPTGVMLIRRSIFDKIPKPIWKVKNTPDLKDDVSEDTIFCEEAIALGYEIWMDTTLTTKVSHLATIPLMAETEQAPNRIIRPNGAEIQFHG